MCANKKEVNEVEFESTLQRAKKRHKLRLEQAKGAGYKEPPEISGVFNLVKDSKSFLKARVYSLKIAQDIQPSIAGEDLKIASDMQLATVCSFVLNLSREGLISINKK